MPVLPTFQDLGQAAARPAGPVTDQAAATEEASRSLISTAAKSGEGMSAFGKGLETAGRGLQIAGKEQEEKRDKIVMNDAVANYTENSSNIRQTLDKEQDPNRVLQHGPDAYRTALETAEQNLTDEQKIEFRQKVQPHMLSSLESVNTRANGLIKDQDVAGATQKLQNFHNDFINAKTDEERHALIASAAGAVENLYLKGHIDQTQAGELGRSWLSNSSKGALNNMPARERLKALGGPDASLMISESGGVPTKINNLGFAGLFQYGAPRLNTLGVYTPAPADNIGNWNNIHGKEDKWHGSFNIPNFPEVKTVEDFLGNKEAQLAVRKIDVDSQDKYIDEQGWDKFIGKNVQGVTMTRAGIRAMIHLGGEGGADAILHGRSWKPDANGTTLLDYARLHGDNQTGTKLGAMMPADDASAMRQHAEREVISDVQRNQVALHEEKARTKSVMDDDIAHIELFGAPKDESPLAAAQVEKLYGPEGRKEWEAKRELASDVFVATNKLEQTPTDQIDARIELLRPREGDSNLDERQKNYDRAVKLGDNYKKQREADPAGYVDAHYDGVKQAKAAYDPAKPETFQRIVKERLIAQDALDPTGMQQRVVISKSEVNNFVHQLTPLVKNDANIWSQQANIQNIAKRIKDEYGTYAPQAYKEILNHLHLSATASFAMASATQVLGDEVVKSIGVPEQATPEPPPGVDKGGWYYAVKHPPVTSKGESFPQDRWASAMRILASNPTPETIRAFNEQSVFGRAGLRAEDYLKQMLPGKFKENEEDKSNKNPPRPKREARTVGAL